MGLRAVGGLEVPRGVGLVAQVVTLACPARPQLQPLALDKPIILGALLAIGVSSGIARRKDISHEVRAVA